MPPRGFGNSNQFNVNQASTNTQFNGSKCLTRSYLLDFRINFNVPHGKKLCIFGNIPEFSNWKKNEPRCFLKQEGANRNRWMLEKPVVTNQFYFIYKFAIMDQDGKFEQFEEGVDRLADLEILPGQDQQIKGDQQYNMKSGLYIQSQPTNNVLKKCTLDHEWEKFFVTFTIANQKDQPNGFITWNDLEHDSSGSYNGQRLMNQKQSTTWMREKYGDHYTPYETHPFEVTFKIQQKKQGIDATWVKDNDNTWQYCYSRETDSKGNYEMEKIQKRTFYVIAQNEYRGQLGLEQTPFWMDTDQVNIVNGEVQKVDGEFFGEPKKQKPKPKPRSPQRPNQRLIKLRQQEAQMIEDDKRRRNEMEQIRRRWEQDTQRFESDQAQKLAHLQKQYDIDYHEYQRKSVQLDNDEQELNERSRNIKFNYENEKQRKIQDKQEELSDEEMTMNQAQEQKNNYKAELERIKNLLQQNKFKNETERKEAERYQAMTEEKFKLWQQEFDKQEQKLQHDFSNETQTTRKKIMEGEQVIDEENERLRLLGLQKQAFTEEEIEDQCDELFSVPPITFKPRIGNDLDYRIEHVIKTNNITIPIKQDPYNENLYLIGDTKLPCDLKNENVIVRFGGGSEQLDSYADRYHRPIEKNLVNHMINSSQSLEWVTDQLIENNKIKAPLVEGYPFGSSPARTRVSPTRVSPTRKSPVQSPRSYPTAVKTSPVRTSPTRTSPVRTSIPAAAKKSPPRSSPTAQNNQSFSPSGKPITPTRKPVSPGTNNQNTLASPTSLKKPKNLSPNGMNR